MRIVHNTTYVIDEAAEQEWIGFVREQYLKEVHASGLAEDALFTRIAVEQPEGNSYSIQLVFRGEEAFRAFTENHLPQLREAMETLYEHRYLCFHTLLTEM